MTRGLRLGLFWALLAMLALPAVVQAQWQCTTNDGKISVTGYTGDAGAVAVPSTLNGLPVTSIGFRAFSFCTGLTSVKLPNGITSIDDAAFVACGSLTSVTIPDGIISIGNAAFELCDQLTDVTIPKSVTNIGYLAFAGCAHLSSITVDPLNSSYSSLGGVLFDKGQTTLVRCPGGKAGNYTIPNSVANIGALAFWKCDLTNVTVGTSVTNIGDNAFLLCTRLPNITLPSSLASIGTKAFHICSSLTAVYFKGNAPILGKETFDRERKATIYYLPGTTGWGKEFGGRPTAVWNPQAMINAACGVQAK